MKKILTGLSILMAATSVFANSQGVTTPFVDLSGTYNCTGTDRLDGSFQSKVTLTLDADNSQTNTGYAAYNYKEVTADGDKYNGYVIGNGNYLSQHFENNKTTEYTDRGIASITVKHDTDSQGNNQIVLHEIYYEPNYNKGDSGSEVCTKQD